MSVKLKMAFGLAMAISASIGAVAVYSQMKGGAMPQVHKLEFPLMLAGDGPSNHRYLLPAGTTLYYDQGFPEGFVRYKIYVNVEGVNLPTREASEKFWIDPLSAFPVDKSQLRKLLADYPLTKEELGSILKSGSLSKQDIRELLAEFSD